MVLQKRGSDTPRLDLTCFYEMNVSNCPRAIDGVLLDISGVLKDGGIAIAGSVNAVRRLRDAGLPIRLLTNETQITRQALTTNLNSLGYSLQEKDIIPPCPVLFKLLQEDNLRPHLLIHPNVMQEFQGINQNNPNCVVIGDATEYFTYDNLNEAFRILMSMEKPRLFSLGQGRYYKEGTELMLDVGAFTAALEYATGIKAEVIGKPDVRYFETALKDMQVTPEKAVMIGDDIVSDVGGAQNCGIMGILVRTGKFRSSDELHPVVHPDAIADNLAEAVSMILGK